MSRRTVFAWHHWTGLLVGAFLLLMSISGSILVFSEEMEEVADREMLRVHNPSGRYTYDASFHQVLQAYPGWEIRLYGQPAANEAIIYELRKKEQSRKIFVHPVDGTILRTLDNGNAQWHRWLLLLHYTLFAGTAGKITVFFIGVLFLVSLVTGLIVYRKAIVKVVTLRSRINVQSRKAFYSSFHRQLGVWSVLFNLLVVVTGLLLSGQVALNALKATRAQKAKASGQVVSLDRLIANTCNAYPNFECHLVRIRANGSSVQLSGRFKDDPSWYGNFYSYFIIEGTTLATEKQQVMKELPVGKKLLTMAGPLHFGNYGGLPLKIVYCLLGMSPGLLSVTGFFIWKKKKHKA